MSAIENHRYNRLSILLHWLTALLFVAVYATIELREIFPKGSVPRDAMKSAHFMLGLSIFALAWLRLAGRLVWPAPRLEPPPAHWQRFLAGAAHTGLYLLMFGMPLAGWLILSAEGKPVPYFGLTLPPLVGPNEALAERVEELHELGGTIGYFLIGLHTLAALVHHYLLRDFVLARMLPARS
jgi:cytochrome b561